MSKTKIVEHAVKIIGEALLVPGSSLLLDGKLKQGIIHFGVGGLAKLFLGVPGLSIVAINSYSTSVTGKGIIGNLFEKRNPKDVSLQKKVEEDIENGLTLEEISARIIEDVEDIFEENNPQSQQHNKDE